MPGCFLNHSFRGLFVIFIFHFVLIYDLAEIKVTGYRLASELHRQNKQTDQLWGGEGRDLVFLSVVLTLAKWTVQGL